MKIMIISDLGPPVWGGAENYIVNLGSRLAKIGHEVHWLTSKLPNTAYHEILDDINIHRVPILYPDRYLFPGRQSFFITSLIPAIKLAKKMDIIQVNSFVPGVLGWLTAKYANKPSLLFVHELFGKLWNKVGQNLFERYGYPLFEKAMAKAPYDWFVCPSEYSKLTLIKQGTPKNKITVIPHGIDLDKFNSNANKTYREKFNLNDYFTIGYAGRLNLRKTTQAKNIQALLSSIKIVAEKIPNSKLILAGSGFEDLIPLIKTLEIEENVMYLGKIPHYEIQNFYMACDVVVCPSLSDGFCFLVAEASACGVPTVATNRGAHLERIVPGKTGLLSNPTAEDISKNIITLNDEILRNEFGHNSVEFTKSFTWEKSIQSHLELYNRLTQQDIK